MASGGRARTNAYDVPEPVLLIGGTGRTGCLLAGRLAQELRVRVLVRDPTAARERLAGDCELFGGNVLARQTLGEALHRRGRRGDRDRRRRELVQLARGWWTSLARATCSG
jgi:uncharacterized protein YbjT (DUF2867 family)